MAWCRTVVVGSAFRRLSSFDIVVNRAVDLVVAVARLCSSPSRLMLSWRSCAVVRAQAPLIHPSKLHLETKHLVFGAVDVIVAPFIRKSKALAIVRRKTMSCGNFANDLLLNMMTMTIATQQ
jgi:hypothetical protein